MSKDGIFVHTPLTGLIYLCRCSKKPKNLRKKQKRMLKFYSEK